MWWFVTVLIASFYAQEGLSLQPIAEANLISDDIISSSPFGNFRTPPEETLKLPEIYQQIPAASYFPPYHVDLSKFFITTDGRPVITELQWYNKMFLYPVVGVWFRDLKPNRDNPEEDIYFMQVWYQRLGVLPYLGFSTFSRKGFFNQVTRDGKDGISEKERLMADLAENFRDASALLQKFPIPNEIHGLLEGMAGKHKALLNMVVKPNGNLWSLVRQDQRYPKLTTPIHIFVNIPPSQ